MRGVAFAAVIYVATFVPLGALGVAAFGLWLTFKERIAAHRSTLYDRQLQAYQEIASGIAQLNSEIVAFVIGGPIPEEKRVPLRGLIANNASTYQSAFRDAAVILPRPVASALVEYRTVLNAISAPARVASQYPTHLARASDPVMDLSKAFERVLDSMREHAGVDKLSAQTVAMIGSRSTDASLQ